MRTFLKLGSLATHTFDAIHDLVLTDLPVVIHNWYWIPNFDKLYIRNASTSQLDILCNTIWMRPFPNWSLLVTRNWC
jgi:hypothetical protein